MGSREQSRGGLSHECGGKARGFFGVPRFGRSGQRATVVSSVAALLQTLVA